MNTSENGDQLTAFIYTATQDDSTAVPDLLFVTVPVLHVKSEPASQNCDETTKLKTPATDLQSTTSKDLLGLDGNSELAQNELRIENEEIGLITPPKASEDPAPSRISESKNRKCKRNRKTGVTVNLKCLKCDFEGKDSESLKDHHLTHADSSKKEKELLKSSDPSDNSKTTQSDSTVVADLLFITVPLLHVKNGIASQNCNQTTNNSGLTKNELKNVKTLKIGNEEVIVREENDVMELIAPPIACDGENKGHGKRLQVDEDPAPAIKRRQSSRLQACEKVFKMSF